MSEEELEELVFEIVASNPDMEPQELQWWLKVETGKTFDETTVTFLGNKALVYLNS